MREIGMGCSPESGESLMRRNKELEQALAQARQTITQLRAQQETKTTRTGRKAESE